MSDLDRVSAMAANTEQRNYFRELFSRRCTDCVLNGETYRGHSRFEYDEGCSRFRCICSCDGSYDCPARYTINICKDGKGKVVEGNSYFELEELCKKYRYCRCRCDGSWECPEEYAEDTCKSRTTPAPVQDSVCQRCYANGKEVEGNTYFELTDGCIEYKNCVCRCNGSWTCPPQYARNTCQEQRGAVRNQSYAINTAECQSCMAYDKYFRGNTYFTIRNGCTRYSNCVCRCDGSWDCPDRYSTNVCTTGDGGGVTDDSDLTCSYCDARGKIIPSNSYFNFTEDCIQYSQCLCHCDGQWTCPEHYARNVCQLPEGGGLVDAEGARFMHEEGCLEYECDCHCNGSYVCPPERVRDTCRTGCTQCKLDGQVYDGNTYFRRRHGCVEYTCTCFSAIATVTDRGNALEKKPEIFVWERAQTCRSCRVSSYVYPGSSSFLLTRGCKQYACRTCVVDGVERPPEENFIITKPCKRFTCFCACNGRWRCPRNQTEDLCPDGDKAKGTDSSSSSSRTSSTADSRQSSVGYQRRLDSDRRRLVSKQEVQVRERTVSTTSADTTWTAHSSPVLEGTIKLIDRVKVVKAKVLTAKVKVSTGKVKVPTVKDKIIMVDEKIYQTGAKFDWRRGCVVYKCSCLCSGSYRCRLSVDPECDQWGFQSDRRLANLEALAATVTSKGRVINTFQQTYFTSGGGGPGSGVLVPVGVVPGQVPQQRQVIQPAAQPQPPAVSHSTTRREMVVPMRQVPVSDSARAASMEDKTCATCFANGRSYRGSFDYTKDCYHVTCYCDCEGKLRCSVQHAMSPACPAQYGPVSGRCRSCVVQGNEYPPRVQFALRVGCYGYDCTCGCDGLWMCPTQMPTNYCVRPASPALGVEGGGYDVLSADYRRTAELTDRTYSRSAEPTAELTEGAGTSCMECDVRGTTYPGRSKFFVRDGCLQHTCDCACDGSWACPKSSTVDICQEGQSEEKEEAREQQEVAEKEGQEMRQQHEDLTMSQRKRALAEVAAYQARLAARQSSCRSCKVDDSTYLPNADFQYRRNCYLYSCTCHCNGTFRCPLSDVRNLCAAADYSEDGCRECKMANKTYPGGAPFTYTEGCWEFNCQCGCNGQADCPPEQSRDLCRAGPSPGRSQADEDAGAVVAPGPAARCKPCVADGQVIRPRSAFTQRTGCTEFLCQCACNGTWTCPRDRSFNYCEQDGSSRQSSADLTAPPKKGKER
nr:hypothetical protein BaRGS_014205 [Batillaria attramentaria]